MTSQMPDAPKAMDDDDLDHAHGGSIPLALMAAPLVTQGGKKRGLKTATTSGKDGSKSGGEDETVWRLEENID